MSQKMNKPRLLSDKEFDRMEENGWIYKSVKCTETQSEIVERLSKDYAKVKVYYDTTCVRGYHRYYAMVKN